MSDDAQEALKVPEGMKAPSMDFAKHVAGQTKMVARLAMGALGVVFALGLMNALREGLLVEDHLALMIAAMLSVVAVWLYNFTAILFAAGSRRRRLFVFTTLGVMLPYLLGFYVVSVRGGWGLILVSRDFEWIGLGLPVTSVMLGGFLLSRLRQLVEIRQWVDDTVGRALPPMPKQFDRSQKRRR